jgi:hypothetical protein
LPVAVTSRIDPVLEATGRLLANILRRPMPIEVED